MPEALLPYLDLDLSSSQHQFRLLPFVVVGFLPDLDGDPRAVAEGQGDLNGGKLPARSQRQRPSHKPASSLRKQTSAAVKRIGLLGKRSRGSAKVIKSRKKIALRCHLRSLNEWEKLQIAPESFFEMIKTDFEQTRLENVENKQLLLVAQQKDESSTAMIAELTQLVKEQKGRIAELVKCKNEQAATHKERTQALEESLEESRKQVTQVELLKQAKSRLQATVQAQESVIEGLKAERRLWGQELAQQGASLSQDRGRLEAKIETLQAEIATLKKQLEREADVVKIKTKMVDDQTETIRKLKEALVERDETVRKTREESLEVQRSLEDQLAEHKAAVEDSREILDRAAARKEELKQQVATLQAELKEAKDGHNILSSRWKEKSALIGRLEEQVTQMKTTWTKKEMQLQAERDAALSQARQAMDKLSVADTAFRQQIDVKEAAMQEQIRQLETEKHQEVELANRKVAMVEDEMRDMLQENEASKRAMEAKVKKLTQALGDLQTDLL
ncbi:hypothetical protein RRG08_015975 [Elysia crispata]|uniref:Uncharacterized protein n=1 Tax=Elysia crispata TaxID=231223 RepID=A0AAE1AEN0_9GAST|nr:hypothetical protein RRG08_015975 [Elysia crispata]